MATVTKRPMGAHMQMWTARILYTELIVAATTKTLALFSLPADAVVSAVDIDTTTLFADSGSISALTVQVGASADNDGFMKATAIFTGASTGKSQVAGAWLSGDGLAVTAKFTATGTDLGNGTVTGLDAGAVEVRVFFRIAK